MSDDKIVMEALAVHVHAFSPIWSERAPVVAIYNDLVLPATDALSLEEYEKLFEKDAEEIVQALIAGLPQGTFDRLGIHFMKATLSLYKGKTGS